MSIIAPSDVHPVAGGNLDSFAQQLLAPQPNAEAEIQAQIQQRQGVQQQRQAQQELVDASFQEQMLRAEEMENALRSAGMSDVADRFRRASRHQAFNVARRGLAGGSADIEQQMETRAGAEREGEQVAEQARMSALEQVMRAIQQRDRLAQTVVSQDPLEATLAQLRTSGVQQGAAEQAAIREAERQIAEARAGRTTGLAQAIGGGLGSLGGVIGGFMQGSAR